MRWGRRFRGKLEGRGSQYHISTLRRFGQKLSHELSRTSNVHRCTGTTTVAVAVARAVTAAHLLKRSSG